NVAQLRPLASISQFAARYGDGLDNPRRNLRDANPPRLTLRQEELNCLRPFVRHLQIPSNTINSSILRVSMACDSAFHDADATEASDYQLFIRSRNRSLCTAR